MFSEIYSYCHDIYHAVRYTMCSYITEVFQSLRFNKAHLRTVCERLGLTALVQHELLLVSMVWNSQWLASVNK